MAKRLAQMGNVYPAISVEGYKKRLMNVEEKEHSKIMQAMEALRDEGVLLAFPLLLPVIILN